MFRVLSVCLAAAACSGCASIASGLHQGVTVNTLSQGTELVGARCKLTNNKGEWYVTSPGSAYVHRSFADLTVTCAHRGFGGGTTDAKSTTGGMVFGNLLIGGILGAGVDVATGAAYDYPRSIWVEMGQAIAPVLAEGVLMPATADRSLVQQPFLTSTPATVASRVAATSTSGEFMASAERLARMYPCGAAPKFVLKGLGFETYSMACTTGEPMILRCDAASCREMK